MVINLFLNLKSVNHDMRDIAIVDYNKVYNLIKKKSNNNLSDVAVIDTWPDRPKWYLGINFPNIYHFRWSDNGFRKKTNFYLNNLGEKIVIPTNNKLVSELTDLEKAMTKYPKGFIWIDDTSLPADVIKYVEKNFYKELYLDHYPI